MSFWFVIITINISITITMPCSQQAVFSRRCLGTSQPLPGMQSSAKIALNHAWWDVFFVRRVRVVWESNFGTSFVLGASGNGRLEGSSSEGW